MSLLVDGLGQGENYQIPVTNTTSNETIMCKCGHIKDGHLDDEGKCFAGECNCKKFKGEEPKYRLRQENYYQGVILSGSAIIPTNQTEWVTDGDGTFMPDSDGQYKGGIGSIAWSNYNRKRF